MSMTMRSVSLRDGGEVVGHERVRTNFLRFGSGYPQRDKNSTSQEGLEDAFNLYDGAAMLAEGRVSGKETTVG